MFGQCGSEYYVPVACIRSHLRERQMVIQGPAGRINHSDTFKCARAVIKIKTTVVPGLSPEVTAVMNL